MKVLRQTGLFLLATAACTAPRVVPELAAPRPNIVLLMSDDQGAGDAGYLGHPTLRTPALDRMAQEGIVFERFYAAAPVCSPTRASCLTGRHPVRMGITGANVGHLPEDVPQLARLLGEAGYATGHFGKWHLGTLTTEVRDANRGGPGGAEHYAPPWDRGFERCFSTESKVPTWDPLVVPEEGLGARAGAGGKAPGEPYGTRYWTGPGESVDSGLEGDDSRLIMDRTLAFIEEAATEERPFLAVVWFHAPHLPTIAGGADLASYADLSLEERHYYGCLTAMDGQLARLRGRLEDLDLGNDTLLWFTSDNGPERNTPGSTAGLRERKRSLHEGGLRVPCLLLWPERLAPRRLALPASTSDFLPTLLEILELPLPEGMDGKSLVPWLVARTDEEAPRGEAIGFHAGRQSAWIGDRYKLITTDGGATHALHDLLEDPGESRDIADENPELTLRLEDELDAWRASL